MLQRIKTLLKDQYLTARKAKGVKGGVIAIIQPAMGPGGGPHLEAGAQKVAMNDFHFVKRCDSATPLI